MKIIKKSLALIAVFCLTFSSLPLYAENQVFIRGVRPLGMGGAFTALSDDKNAMFYNPAGITQREGSEFTLFELPVTIGQDLFSFYDFFNAKQDDLKDFDKLPNDKKIDLLNEINDKVTKYRAKIMLGFPNMSYLSSGKGYMSWGLGLFDEANIGFQFNRSLILPNISYWGSVDGVAMVPLAHKFNKLPYDIPGSLSVGLTGKYIMRANVAEYNKSILEFESLSPTLQMGRGYGFDIGTLYHYNKRWNFGLQIADIGGTTISYDAVEAEKGTAAKAAYTGMINSQWTVGSAYTPSKIYYWPGKSIKTKNRVVFVADVKDVLSSDERLLTSSFFKKLHLGTEFRWGPMSIRGGFNSGYPSCGFGLRIPYLGLRADYAYWTDEIGLFAGQIAESNHRLSLALSWGDHKGKAYGKDVKEESEAVEEKKVIPQKQKKASEVLEEKDKQLQKEAEAVKAQTEKTDAAIQPVNEAVQAQPAKAAETIKTAEQKVEAVAAETKQTAETVKAAEQKAEVKKEEVKKAASDTKKTVQEKTAAPVTK